VDCSENDNQHPGYFIKVKQTLAPGKTFFNADISLIIYAS
jgi:hypothetical protein